jgi:hypothetical protein
MDLEVIAEGKGTDTTAAEVAAAKIEPGAFVEIRVFVDVAPSPEALATLQSDLLSKGVVLVEPLVYESGVIIARYTNAPPVATQATSIGIVPVLAAVGLSVPGLIIGGIALVGVVVFAWQMSKQVGNTLNNPLLIFAAVALVIIYFMMRTPSKPASQEVQQ